MTRTKRGLHGVFIGSHAVAAGAVTPKQLKAGLYRRLLHGIYADPGLTADHRLQARGAMLLMPGDAVLGGRTAAAWFGAPFASAADPVLAVVPPESPWRGPRGVRVHRTTLGRDEAMAVEEMDGVVRLTTPLRTVWDICTLEPVATAVGLIDGMVRSGHVDRRGVNRLMAAAVGR